MSNKPATVEQVAQGLYLAFEQMADKYGFTADQRQQLAAALVFDLQREMGGFPVAMKVSNG